MYAFARISFSNEIDVDFRLSTSVSTCGSVEAYVLSVGV